MRGIRTVRWALLPVAAALVWAGAALAASAHSRVGHATPARSIAALRVHGTRAGDNHAAARVLRHLSRPMGSGTSTLYAQDGTCPDGVDVYSVTGTAVTHIENVSVGCSGGQYYGNQQLAVMTTPADCLLFNDEDGNVYSFTIDSLTGEIPSSPSSTVATGGNPGDLLVSGSTVYASDSANHELDVLTVGSGCALTLRSENSTGKEDDTNIALANPTTVVSADYTSGDLVAYTKQSNDTLVETANSPGQLENPDGAATQDLGSSALVFSGEVGTDPPQTQGSILHGSSFTPLKGSPAQAGDPGSSGGYFVALSSANRLLVQADVLSSQIGWYTVTGHGLSYGGDTYLARSGGQAAEFTIAGDDLLVPQALTGDVEACALATSGVSGCRMILRTTGAGHGNAASVAVF